MDYTHMFMFFVVLIISLTVHEAAHALIALKGGDRTAYLGGQVTLNPLPHMRREPFGMVILPLVMLFMSQGRFCMGFASTPIDPVWAYHHPKKAALMSAAGPLANLLLAAIGFGVMFALYPDTAEWERTVYTIARTFLFLNLLLCLFNLFPVPPLDGAGVVEGLFPKSRGFYQMLRSQPMFGLMGIIAVMVLINRTYPPIWDVVRRLVER